MGGAFFISPGGKGANQAVAAQRSGAHTYMIGSVGDDVFGKQLTTSLEREKIDCDFILKEKDVSTGIAMIIRNKGDNRIILGAGANHDVTVEHVEEAIRKISHTNDIFLTQFENDYEVVLESMTKAKQQKLFTIFNPAPAKIIPAKIYKSIDLLIVNQWESEMLTGIYPKNEEDCQKAIRLLIDKGTRSVIITMGAGGSTYGNCDQYLFIPSSQTTVVDTTAAGDTYIGSLAYGLSADMEIKAAMIYATKAAALSITKQGAQESIPYKKGHREILRRSSDDEETSYYRYGSGN
ncbi:ribokinase [Virgibacillus halophilus]|uniref:Ribokinase n=1 Tax=Tigheibacillus halophilus TaxID=361280 RepID=A0ABU5C405_9BACI|nr:ribokinase [Virgibacillus halophilus]